MADCCNPSGYRHFFNQREARRNLRNYDKRGLDKTARQMVDYIVSRGLQGRTVLEVGGGIGAAQVEMLRAGAQETINVELSGGYEEVAAELLLREGLEDVVVRRLGDFTELAEDLEADDVFMNRVLCCYPLMEKLLGAALDSSRRFVATSFPRDHIGAKMAFGLGNTYCRIRNVDFRAFVHATRAVEQTARAKHFKKVLHERGLVWQGLVFERTR